MAKQLRTMDTKALIALRGQIDGILASRRKQLEAQLSAFDGEDPFPLSGRVGGRAKRIATKLLRVGRKKRAKAKPKYQSKKNKSLKWSGRGMTPVWMRDEMRGTKLKKDDFLIK